MARMTAIERRTQIAGAARELFAERGYAAVAVDEIARHAGISPPVVYDHFDSKQDLYAHVVERQAADLATRVALATGEVSGGKARLRASFDAFFALAEEQPLVAGDDPRAHAALADVLASGGRLFADERDRDRALDLTAQMLRHGLLGLSAWWREHPETPRAVLVDHAMAVAWTGLRALRKR
jgi:AcrR family transcriptional regulator